MPEVSLALALALSLALAPACGAEVELAASLVLAAGAGAEVDDEQAETPPTSATAAAKDTIWRLPTVIMRLEGRPFRHQPGTQPGSHAAVSPEWMTGSAELRTLSSASHLL